MIVSISTKLLLTSVIGGLGGVSVYTSLSNWDPKELWRITANNKFYLSSCFNDPVDKTGITTVSDLWIYLTVKEPKIGKIEKDTELTLWAEGYHKQVDNGKDVSSNRYSYRNLQNSITGNGGKSSDYTLRKQTRVQLGESGGGELSETFGGDIKCNNTFFDLPNANQEKIVEIRLDKVTFKLKENENLILKNKYKGYEVYSIDITNNDNSEGKGKQEIKWADNFEPIVIV